MLGTIVVQYSTKYTEKQFPNTITGERGLGQDSLVASLSRTPTSRGEDFLTRPMACLGRYDYLLIETSGVSDPESIIRSLDKSFGKLTRAR